MLSLCKRLAQQASIRLKPKLTQSTVEVMMDEECSEKQSIDDDSTESVEIEWAAPEGGWGYMVGLGFSLMFIVAVGPISSYGVIFKDFFEGTGDGTSGLTLVNGVNNAVVSFTGFFTTSALKKYSLRQVGLFGAFTFVFGSFLTIFTNSVPYLVFSCGFLQGIGFGVMIPICLTSLNNYFVKRRVAVMGGTSVFVGIGFMFFPAGIKYFMEEYGFRGTLALICAISLHAILAMVIMQPIEWHLVPKIKESKENIPVSNKFYSDISLTMEKVPNEKSIEMHCLKSISENSKEAEAMENKEPLLIQSVVKKIHHLKPTISMLSIVEKPPPANFNVIFSDHHEFDENYSSNLAKASSLASLGNWTSVALASEAIPVKDGKWQTFVNNFDFSLLKEPVYANMCLGMTFSFFSEMTFFLMEPLILYHYDFTQSEVLLCITAGATADLIFRILLAIYTFYFSVNSRLVFYFGTLSIVILRTIFMQFQDFYNLLILTACLGSFRSWIHVFLPLVFAEHLSNESFPSGYGLFMMLSGITTLTMSAVVGYLRDYTDSYTIAVHFLNACCLVLLIPWTIEFYLRYRNRKKSTSDK